MWSSEWSSSVRTRAGMSAAHQALRVARTHGRTLEVVVVERSTHTSYSACGIPYWIAGDVETPTGSSPAPPTGTARSASTCACSRRPSRSTSLPGRSPSRGPAAVPTSSGSTNSSSPPGRIPRVPPWALRRVTAAGCPVCARSRPSTTVPPGSAAVTGRSARRRATPERAVVVGGGYIGIETAEAFVRRGLQTTLVTRREVMSTLDPDMGARVRQAMTAGGVRVVCSEEVDGLDVRRDGVVAAVRSGGDAFPADVVALGLGVAPATELAAAAGLPLGAFGGLLPDDRQRVAGRRLGGGRLLRVRRAPRRPARVRAARDARQQAGPGRGREPRRRRRPVRRRARHGHHPVPAGGVHVEVGRTGPTTEQATAAG